MSLTRENPDLRRVVVGISWDTRTDPVLADNVRLAALLCDEAGTAASRDSLVFFNQFESADQSVCIVAGEEDVEQVEIDLPLVPSHVQRIVFVLYLNDGSPKRRTLSQLRTCSVRVLDAASDRALVRSVDLAGDLTTETAVVLGEIYRHQQHWKFRVVGQGHSTGLAGVSRQFGVPL